MRDWVFTLGLLLVLATGTAAAGLDTDGDGVADGDDNCPLDANCLPGMVQIGQIVPLDAQDSDEAGTSVALSADGKTAVVGSPFSSGAVHVFAWVDGVWVETQELTSGSSSFHRFGTSAALSTDGSTMIVGAPSGTEAAYVFTANDGVFEPAQTLTASTPSSADGYGYRVDVSSDGTKLAVGSWNDADAATGAGSVYVYTFDGSSWVEQQEIFATDAAVHDSFGVALAMSADGSKLLVGAPGVDSDRGAVYAFTEIGGIWSQVQRLVAGDRAFDDRFGTSIAFSADGNSALIGAWQVDGDLYEDAGAVYWFTESVGVWTEQQKFVSPIDESRKFGVSVSMTADGTAAVVGAIGGDEAAFGFALEQGAWTFKQRISSPEAESTGFGVAVAIAAEDGDRVAVGAPFSHTPFVGPTGSAYFYLSRCQLDRDEDGFGDTCDCEPTDSRSFPGNVETCDGVDNDCNSMVDEGVSGWSCDGIGECGAGLTECYGTDGMRCSTDAGGSEDQSVAEVCDGVDNDCDGLSDEEDAINAPVWYDDADGDGFGDPGSAVEACNLPSGFVADGTDNCPATSNAMQADSDGDMLGDACDNCPTAANCEPSLSALGKLEVADLESDEFFGTAVALSADGMRAIVGAPGFGVAPGAAYILDRVGSAWAVRTKLIASDATEWARFGSSVALTPDGQTAFVGAPNARATYVFSRTEGAWTESQKLVPQSAGGPKFGLALAADPETLVVGAPWGAPWDDPGTGSIYVFGLIDGAWTELQELVGSNVSDSAEFGHSVAITPGATRLLVGAYGDDSAYVFDRSGADTWTEQAELVPLFPEPSRNFGISVALSADGTTALVGAPGPPAYEPDEWTRGEAVVFAETGGVWTWEDELKSVWNWDTLGSSVALSADGDTAVIADLSSPLGGGAGVVRGYRRENDDWEQAFSLNPLDGASDDLFGSSVALTPDGSTFVVGAPRHTDVSFWEGAAYPFSEACTNPDGDGDGAGDACDCDPAYPGYWATPGAITTLALGPDTSTLVWEAPDEAGGLNEALRYDTLRSAGPLDFAGGAGCVETNDGSDRQATDTNEPAPGGVHYYLVRPENGCGLGAIGEASSGPRPPAASCEGP